MRFVRARFGRRDGGRSEHCSIGGTAMVLMDRACQNIRGVETSTGLTEFVGFVAEGERLKFGMRAGEACSA